MVVAPLLEEAIFRVALFRLAHVLSIRRSVAALVSATLFGLLHVRFGAWFVGYAFVGGLVLWATHARAGYRAAVGIHLAVNLADLSLGWRRRLYSRAA